MRNSLAQEQAQLLPCTVVLYDKGGTIQGAGFLVTVFQIKVACRRQSSRPMASPMQGNARYVIDFFKVGLLYLSLLLYKSRINEPSRHQR